MNGASTTLGEIAEHLNLVLDGDRGIEITGVQTLAAAGRASVRGGVADEAEDYAEAGVASGSALVRELGPMPELREAMGLAWRALVLWLAVLALLVIAGWAG